ncbi:Man1-Src1p-C-terminal domain-containing protein [Dioszegia hungarica]|uniref:Man1-Src1p-C-terminal domain-containing protein n=1 Tax=Dioszegia hungarica TaxID=4972 RepID=A0AA38H862_9TREE|nr:Man1-Src1p-C-terminal domain-containing protein [Dioszegia hungarica]KAI9635585.1 Man1-Src1p-C-terminal domain-containing protein [Dioszegia hungarica]
MSTPSMDEYLAPDFDPFTLKVPQLRSILVEHGIPFGAVIKKSDLIDLFEDNVRPKASKLLGKSSGVKASAKGIISVSESGEESLVEAPVKKPRGRPRKTPIVEVMDDSPEPDAAPPSKRLRARSRMSVDTEGADTQPSVKSTSSRRSTLNTSRKRTPAVTPEVVPPLPVASSSRKSRQSSAATQHATPSSAATRHITPDAGDKTPVPAPRSILKKDTAIHFVDQPEADSEADEIPRHTPVKRKASRTPRRSDGEESGFSDVNPFQSGSDQAARKELRRRKSSVGPAQTPASPQQETPRQPRRSEPAPMSFTPGSTLRRVGPSRESLRAPPDEVREQMMQDRELQEAEEHNQVVSTKLNEISSRDRESPPQVTITTVYEATPVPASQNALVKRAQDKLQVVPAASRTVPLSALFLVLLSWVAQWKHASSAIGFCDTGGATNNVILLRESKIDNAQACIARNAALQLDSAVGQPSTELVRCDTTSLPLLPFMPRPTACSPCPPHAVCEAGNLAACEPEYILSHHPLSVFSALTDGLPGMEPRTFPPSCKPDTARKRLIGGVAQEVEGYLAQGRGKVVCAGMGKEDGRKGEGERFGMEEETLREMFDARRDPKFTKEQFDEVWEAALRDLVEHEDIIESIDVHGKSWYAASRTDMTLSCRAKTEAYKSLDAWKAQLGSTAAVLAAIAALQRTIKTRRAEKYKAEDLAAVVLKRLQDQERLHYTDPATTPHPYLPPAQVRDLVLPHRGSVSSRTRLWTRIEALIEKNANVATREREVNGEIWRTWEWTGVGMLGAAGEQ